jgi:hypothetical protein
MNSTEVIPNHIKDYYVVCSLSGVFALTAVAISCAILVLVKRTKPRLHTVRHLLMCNTCIASILYCIVQLNNYIFLIFLPWQTSDIGCRWRGYFAYVSICAVIYSYLNQAISRLFISIFSTKYKRLTTFKAHYILIVVQWFVITLLPLPSIITKDIYFRPDALCWVPAKDTIHTCYIYIVYYIIPALSIGMIYMFIYYRVRKTTNQAQTLVRRANTEKRDLELLRNISILLGVYFMGAVPTLLFLVTSNRILYLIGIVAISLAVAIEKVCAILLDRELRQVFRALVTRTAHITPIDDTYLTARNQQNLTRIQPTVVQPSSKNQNIQFQLT